MIFGNEKYVMQFNDGTFLKRGVYTGFLNAQNGFEIGKTTNLNEAVYFSDEAGAQRIAHNIGLKETYKLKEIEVIIKLM